MQTASRNTPPSDPGSTLAFRCRSVLLDLALWAVALGALPRPEGHPETWFADNALVPQIIACAKENASRRPEIRALLRERESLTRALVSALRPTFRGALKRTKRERAHAVGVGEEDSLQDGALGLLRAVELWDPYRGLQFNTFANHWIAMSTRRGAQRNSHVKCSAVNSESAQRRLEGRRALAQPRFSLEDLTSDLSTETALRNLVNTTLSVRPDVEARIDERAFRSALTEALAKLTPRMQEIAISHIYRDETYHEIAHRLGVTRQAVGLAWLKIEAHLRKTLKGRLVGSLAQAKSRA